MSLQDIVNVQISLSGKPISYEGFGTMLFVSGGTQWNSSTDRVRTYSQSSDVKKAFPDTMGAVAKYTGTMTSGSISVNITKIDGTTAAISQSYSSNLAGTLTAFALLIAAVDSVASATVLAGALTIVMNPGYAAPSAYTAFSLTKGGSDTLAGAYANTDAPSQEYNAALACFSQSPTPSQFMIGQKKTGESYATALDACATVNSNWYSFAINSRTQADILGTQTLGVWSGGAAQWAEANGKIFFVADNNANDGAPSSAYSTDTSTLGILSGLGLFRTFFVWSGGATNGTAPLAFPEIAAFYSTGTYTPGSYTNAFKALAGITPDTGSEAFTTTFSDVVRGTDGSPAPKFGNTYELVGGYHWLLDGKVVGNEYYDVIVFRDWLQNHLTMDVLALLNNNPKVPFTDNGIHAVKNIIQSDLEQGITNGGISPDVAYSITVPKSSAVSSSDHASRKLTGVSFTANLAGAIQAISITGTLVE